MAQLLAYFTQTLLFTVGPLMLFGAILYFARALFSFFVGEREGRRLLLALYAPTTPMRELAHALSAVLFLHRVGDVVFLQWHDPDGELGYVEHSYDPRNPIALLGNFVYALSPILLGLAAVFMVFLLCFGDVMPDFCKQIEQLSATDAGFAAYAAAAFGLLPAMLQAQAPLSVKLLGFALLLALCMGMFLSVQELLEGLSGLFIYAGICLVFCLVLLLFDARVERTALAALRGFATGVTALFLAVCLCACVLLLLGALFFVIRVLFFTGGNCDGRQSEMRYLAEKNTNN